MFIKKAIKNRKLQKSNALELIPLALVGHENIEGEKVQLLVRRFRFDFMNNIFGKSSFFRVKLDSLGSVAWKKIDGKKTIFEIASLLENEENIEERMVIFFTDLYRRDLIDFVK